MVIYFRLSLLIEITAEPTNNCYRRDNSNDLYLQLSAIYTEVVYNNQLDLWIFLRLQQCAGDRYIEIPL